LSLLIRVWLVTPERDIAQSIARLGIQHTVKNISAAS
jgi:hypothetical protein